MKLEHSLHHPQNLHSAIVRSWAQMLYRKKQYFLASYQEIATSTFTFKRLTKVEIDQIEWMGTHGAKLIYSVTLNKTGEKYIVADDYLYGFFKYFTIWKDITDRGY